MNPNTAAEPHSPATPETVPTLDADAFDALDTILDDLRTRFDETPQWEFCEGFMAALIVMRSAIAPEEYFPVLLDIAVTTVAVDASTDGVFEAAVAGDAQEAEAVVEESGATFSSAAQQQQFLQLWQRRWAEIEAGLDTEVQSLDDERAYHPEVMDVRGAVAALPPQERAAMESEHLPSFAQVWAVGFMYAVESWPQEWTPPRDRELRKVLDQALDCLVALTEDDTGVPTLALFDEAAPPSVSESRFNAFAEGVWAVYDLRALWRSVGPRVAPVQREAEPGRNDACPCGSGKKYKKCHGQ